MTNIPDDVVKVHVTSTAVPMPETAQYQRVHPQMFRATTTDIQLYTATLEVPIMGWSFSEPTGLAPATFDLYDGLDPTGILIASITLAASESTRDYLGPWGIMLRTGLFLDMLTGAVKGSVWLGKPL